MLNNKSKFTNKIFQGFLNCKTKATLYLQRKVGTPSEFENLKIDLENQHRKTAIRKLAENYSKDEVLYSPPRFSKSVQSKHQLVVNVCIDDNEFDLQLDAFEINATKAGHQKRYEFIPILFLKNKKIISNDKLLLAFHGFILSKVHNKNIQRGKIIYDENCKMHNVKLARLFPRVKEIIKDIDELRENPVDVCLNKHCQICEFSKECERIAKEKDHLSLIRGMSEKEVIKQNKKGIFTVTQLSYTFRPRRKGKRVKDKTPNHYFALKALAIRENKIFIFETPKLPKFNVQIFLDVEGTPDEDYYYLISLIVVNYNEQKEYSLWANDKREEDIICRQFLDIVGKYNDFIIYHYGNYEIKFLNKIRKKHAENAELVDKIIEKACNVLSFVYLYFYFPTYSNSLKDICKYLGFKWTSKDASGIKSIVWRRRWKISSSENLKRILVQYSIEDCLALQELTVSIYKIIEKRDLNLTGPENLEIVDTRELKKKGGFWGKARFGKVQFASEDLEYINRCSYFDYQREKVYVRTNKYLKKVVIKKKSNINPKPNKYIYFRCIKCPNCKSFGIDKIEEETKEKTVFDLKFTKNGVKKWIVTYVAHRYKCPKCRKLFYSRKLNLSKIQKYAHNLRAWITYQYVINRLSYENIQRYLFDVFGMSINFQAIYKAKKEITKYYQSTYKKILKKVVVGNIIHADETKINLKLDTGYVWVLANIEEVVYIYRPNRESDFLKELLRRFKGVLISDFFTGYDSIDCEQQKCLIHLIRDLNSDLLENPFDEDYKEIVQHFSIMLRKIVETIDKYGLKKRHLNKHKKDVQRFFEIILQKKYNSELVQQYQKRFKKNENKLFTFLGHDGVSWNNNTAENAIKYFAKWRRLVSGRVAESGVNDFCLFLTISQTCERKGISFLNFLLSKEKNIDKITGQDKKSIIPGQMFIRTKKFRDKNGNIVREYEQLVEAYREKGKVKQKVIMTLGRKGETSADRIEKIVRALIKKTPKLKLVKKSD
jgi:predicted RecB family nuclease